MSPTMMQDGLGRDDSVALSGLRTMTIGFIGYGNMAQAIARGLVDSGQVNGGQMVATAAHVDKLEDAAASLGVRPMHSAVEVAAASDMVIMAVKPQQVEPVLTAVREELSQPRRFLLSVAGGWNLARYSKLIGDHAHIQCAIPNTPIAVGQGVLVAERDNSLSAEQSAAFESLFGHIALIERVDSDLMSIGSSLAGSGPAFADIFIESLADAGVEFGLKRQQAYRLAAKMIEGSGALCLASSTHPGALKDSVCSPAGTTIRGVSALEHKGFRAAVISAIEAMENMERQ